MPVITASRPCAQNARPCQYSPCLGTISAMSWHLRVLKLNRARTRPCRPMSLLPRSRGQHPGELVLRAKGRYVHLAARGGDDEPGAQSALGASRCPCCAPPVLRATQGELPDSSILSHKDSIGAGQAAEDHSTCAYECGIQMEWFHGSMYFMRG
jgi:hypothetical protein